MLAIFLGLGLALVLLFAWETAFERHQEAAGPDIPPAEVRGSENTAALSPAATSRFSR